MTVSLRPEVDAAEGKSNSTTFSFGSFVSSLWSSNTVRAEEEKEEDDASDGEREEAKETPEEEEEDEEPEDPAPAIRDHCAETTCAEAKHHFEHCEEKVKSGKGFKGEDCTEELFHLLHCVDSCAAPKIFKKLA